ncbi:hypothetical protein [Acidovorax kalamii]|uniref:hypothetical protein n=1 Tax=Acidovorax kalamii TaxID=2004485 RepID=UPI002091B5A6|nr:hypothetical protein [Acidovorax kalamii]MCO5358628.1 hypothetical protein [Acidovorax kalamii]
MAVQIGRKILEGYVLTGKVYGVEQNSQVVYREEHIPLNNGKYLARSAENKTSWWIKLGDGTEKQLRITEQVPMRDGHEVTLIYTGWRNADNMYAAAVFNATTKQLYRYTAPVIARRVNFGGAFGGGCLIPSLGLAAIPAMPIAASSFGMGWFGFGVGLVIFAASIVHMLRVGGRRIDQFEKDLQSEFQIALGWNKWVPDGVSIVTWTE